MLPSSVGFVLFVTHCICGLCVSWAGCSPHNRGDSSWSCSPCYICSFSLKLEVVFCWIRKSFAEYACVCSSGIQGIPVTCAQRETLMRDKAKAHSIFVLKTAKTTIPRSVLKLPWEQMCFTLKSGPDCKGLWGIDTQQLRQVIRGLRVLPSVSSKTVAIKET